MTNRLVLATQAADSLGDYGVEWFYLATPLVLGLGAIAYLYFSGEGKHPLGRVSSSLERVTGLPSYSAGGIGMSLWALIVAVLGFYWDVAWHIELGRDQLIFTPAHLGILLGLTLILCAGLASIALATYERVPTRLRFRGLRVPYGAVAITLLGAGALIGFPLDEFWHSAYGIDVTMWGPTHLVMISGASLTPLGMLLLYRQGLSRSEPTRLGKWFAPVVSGAALVGLSTWTGEFDFSVPQFQALYHPVLVMAGSSLALVAARRFLGPGGAIRAAVGALAIRGSIAVVLGLGLGLVTPRFPLYLGSAIVVEIAFKLAQRLRPASAVLFVGGALGTLGFATEWIWSVLWARHPWTADLGPAALLATVAAIATTAIGWAIGDVLASQRPGLDRRHLVLAAAMLIVTLVLPLPRNDAHIDAVVTTERVGDGRARVQIALDPADAAGGANWFEVMAWQGGAVEVHPLRQVEPGRYAMEGSVPVTGDWKTVVRLAKDDTIVGTAVYMPRDEEIGASEIPLAPRREVELVRDTEFLMREATEGPAWPALVAYAVILLLAVVWIGALTRGFSRVAPGSSEGPTRPAPRTRQVPA